VIKYLNAIVELQN